MLMRSLVIASLAGLASLAVNAAAAQEGPQAIAVYDGANFDDAASLDGKRWTLSTQASSSEQTLAFAPYAAPAQRDSRRYEFEVGARGVAGLLDVSLAQHASIGADASGDISRRGRGAELRLGRGVNMPRQKRADWRHPILYGFVAADDEAITWRPGVRNAFGDSGSSFALQDRVEIGDRQAGITYERGPLQASLAYVERSVDARSGGRTYSRDERFTGITLTMRH
ncbi:MAG TPA: hypothetical protein VG841_00730 [Caulobacterales bacterium]|nr:hypothetical protein [Caulobacterales bacterium]